MYWYDVFTVTRIHMVLAVNIQENLNRMLYLETQ
jgi:hypothetical protein